MKKNVSITLFTLVVICYSCPSAKQNNEDQLYNVTWELEFISGPRIAFEGLYPDKKPKITFNKDTKKAEGNNSCNGYLADFTIEGETISFGDPAPTTMMYCGEGETVFLKTIKKVNKYTVDTDGKLNLMVDNVPMMRFKNIK